jgi:hypothetical protein
MNDFDWSEAFAFALACVALISVVAIILRVAGWT